jgi:hypothetical protein
MNLIVGIVGSVIATVVVGLIVAGYKMWFGQQIKITHPQPTETLTNPEPLGQSRSWPVKGELKRLPKAHEIWLLHQDEKTGVIFPQGFSIVKYDHRNGTWVGKISAGPPGSIRIVVVVAPPTSQDFFRYYQQVGQSRGHIFEPLKRIPPECRNHASVQAFVP